MKHQYGFMLIEVMIAALISTIIGAALFVCLDQINRVTVITQNYADIYAKAAIVNKQFERDLAGFFLPLASQKELTEKKADVSKELPAEADQQKDKNKKPTEPEKKSDEKPIKQITKVFYAKNKDKNIELLTFITNNPMQVYWSDKSGKAKPRIARVVYRLIPDKEFKNSFILSRQEGNDLYFDAYTKSDKNAPRQYEMIDGIKSLSIEYAVEKPSQSEDKKDEKKDEAKKPKEYIMKKEWKDSAENKEQNAASSSDDKKNEKKEKKQFPEYVLISMALWDDQKKRDTQFVFQIPLIAEGEQPAEPQESIAARLLEQSKTANQPAQPSTGQPQPGIPQQVVQNTTSPLQTETTKTTNVAANPEPGIIYLTMDEFNIRHRSGDKEVINGIQQGKIKIVEGSLKGASRA